MRKYVSWAIIALSVRMKRLFDCEIVTLSASKGRYVEMD